MTELDALLVRQYQGGYAPHHHAHAQVLIGLAGTLQLEVEGRAAFVDPSCGVVLPAGYRHAYFTDSEARVLVLDCPQGPGTDRFRRFAVGAQWVRRLRSCSPQELLAQVDGARDHGVRRRLDLEALTRRIDERLDHPWSLAGLASACHMSPQRFRARFAEVTGVSPLAYVRQRRLAQAGRLLRAGWQLEAVALQVGYRTASALSHALRRDCAVGAAQLRLGLPPAA